MSTRSTTHFVHGDRREAIVYRHYDGYPEGAGTDIFRFFEAVKAETNDTRFTDPSYLAAKYVVYLAIMFADDYERPLDFLGVGVLLQDPSDIEYRYVVDCGKIDADGLPSVTCYPVSFTEGTQPPVEIPQPERTA